MLSFNGSDLGEYHFRQFVLWCWPINIYTTKIPVLMAIIQLNGTTYPVYLKRNALARNDQCIVDEIKPLFGLTKMGIHMCKLYGIPKKIVDSKPWVFDGYLNMGLQSRLSNYLVLRAETELGPNHQPQFVLYSDIRTINWSSLDPESEDVRRMYYEIQKILVFRSILRISDTSIDNLLIKSNPYRKYQIGPLSIDEMLINEPSATWSSALTVTQENFFFPCPEAKGQILVKLFGMTKDNYVDILQQLSRSMIKVINRFNPDKIWLADWVVDQMDNIIQLYFHNEDII